MEEKRRFRYTLCFVSLLIGIILMLAFLFFMYRRQQAGKKAA